MIYNIASNAILFGWNIYHNTKEFSSINLKILKLPEQNNAHSVVKKIKLMQCVNITPGVECCIRT